MPPLLSGHKRLKARLETEYLPRRCGQVLRIRRRRSRPRLAGEPRLVGPARRRHRARRAGRRARPTTARWCWSGGCAMRSRGSTRSCPPRRSTTPSASSRGPRAPTLVARNRAVHRLLVDGVTVEYRTRRRRDPRRAGAGDRLRCARQQRLAGGQPVHRRREQAHPPAGRRAVRQRPAAGGDRAEERRRRERHDLDGLPAAPDLQGGDAGAVRLQRSCSSSPTASRRASARSPPGASGSSPGARSRARRWPTRTCRSCRWCIEGVFDKRRFLDLVRHFIVFEDDGGGTLVKKMAGYHQFHAVQRGGGRDAARGRAAPRRRGVIDEPGRYEARRPPGGEPGDRRVGVVWHTQGSGKSLTMAFYAGRIIREPAMENPTIVVLTDRNDLDDQLFGTFSRCQDLLRQPPVQAESRARPARAAQRRGGRRGLHHHPEVLPGGEGRPASGALRAAQHRGHRRRGAPQPVRLHRRLRAAHARRAAECLVHRLHRHADRADGREHPRRLRRLHQRLRHPARRGGRRHGADLLREPAGQARSSTRPSGRRSTRSSRR